jgi:hypothetical protein
MAFARSGTLNKKNWILAVATVCLYALHQDVWLFGAARPLLLGFLPPGLSYHAAYIGLVTLLMAALVRWAWPAHLEKHDLHEEERR